MAKKKTSGMKAKTRPAGKKRPVKVWHIFNYEQRFELPDDNRRCRKGPLLFAKYVISGSDDESLNLQDQIQSLRSFGLPWMLLKGCFYELVSVAGNRSRMYRGYLLDQEYKPATTKKISLWLDMDIKETSKVLNALSQAGLIERVPLPEFDPDDNDPPMEGTEKPGGKSGSSGKHKTTRQAGRTQNSAIRGAGRKFPAPFKKGEDEAVRGNRIENEDEKKRSESEGEGNLISNAIGSLDRKPEGKPCPRPTEPTESDAGAGAICRDAGSHPPPSIVSGLDDLYSPRTFAMAVYGAMGFTWPLEILKARQELGAFESCWERALDSGLPPSALQDLWDKSIKEAAALNRKKRRCRNVSAVWMDVFNKRLTAQKTRASPKEEAG